MILAAGRGSRMSTLTKSGPKCLVQVDGRTLLDRQISALKRAGIDQIAVVGGWRIDSLRDLAIPVLENPAWESTSMVHSLMAAASWIGDDSVCVAYGDIVFGSDVVAQMIANDGELVIAYDQQWYEKWSARFSDPLADAETFQVALDGSLITIGSRASDVADIAGQYMGLLVIRPSALSAIREFISVNDVASMTQILDLLVSQGLCTVQCVATREPWFEFDTVRDIEVGIGYLRELDAIERDASGNHRAPVH
ncbi:MAG: phosphocholine cytidylyltransferase family protein [Acidimicrobiaceae bacterium]|nr:phosphocholine cytidylyltransferase family protein [Acidimicrobiaceae bacterium]